MGRGRYRIDWGNETYFEEIDFYFDALGDYSKTIGNFVALKVEQGKVRFESAQAEYDTNPDSVDWLDEYGKFVSANRLEDILFDSCLTATMSFVERRLVFLCRELEKKNTVKLTDVSGNGVHKFHLYLTKVCGVRTEEAKDSWEKLFLFNQLRNIIVHSDRNRVIPSERKPLLNLMRDTPGIRFSQGDNGMAFTFTSDAIVHELLKVGKAVLWNAYTEKVVLG